MRGRFLVILSALLGLGAVACARREPAEAGAGDRWQALAGGRWVDLTHDFSDETIVWPTSEPFRLEVVSAERTPAGYWYASNDFSTSEHGGTHLDAPVHFAEGGHTAERIPLERLVGPAAVVDVSDSAARNPDYLVSAVDLGRWEREHGRLAAGTIVLLRTGWAARWPDRGRYLGTTKTGAAAVAELRFPGVDPAAARLLVERGVDAVGIDTPSMDYGRSKTFETHQVLAAANVPAFENVASLDELPAEGAFVVALPMKIEGGSGGPLRIVAVLP